MKKGQANYFTLETMELNKSFCGVQGRFFQKKPLAAGGKKIKKYPPYILVILPGEYRPDF